MYDALLELFGAVFGLFEYEPFIALIAMFCLYPVMAFILSVKGVK